MYCPMIKRSLVILILVVFPLLLVSAEEPCNDRPKVGLVLSGGGAKGLAHIGVIKVLEEVGIRPDYITGTSMGSIIGGLYSIGYTATELDSIVSTADWAHLLSDRVPLSDVIPEEKTDYQRFQVELDITEDGFVVPMGLIGGHAISELFARLSARVSGTYYFKDYPIPFKCVAADLLSGEQVIFDRGSFSTALRSSMSIPSVFSPVELDTLYLVDGGVLNNFPVDLCREMGADIIIGVNVGNADRVNKADLNSLIGVLTTSAMIANSSNNRAQLPYVDVVIMPDLTGYNIASFFNAPQIIERGELAAREVYGQLDSLAKFLDQFDKPKPLSIPSDPVEFVISRVEVDGLEKVSRRFFISGLGINAGDTVDFSLLSQGVNRLVGTRYFDYVTYNLEPEGGKYVLKMNTQESAPAKFKFSIHYDNEYKAGILTNITLRNLLWKGNRFSTTLDIAEKPRFNVTAINYYGENHLTASKLVFDREVNNFPVYMNDGRVYGTLTHHYTDLAFGFMSSIGTSWEIDAYLEYERSMLTDQTGMYEIFSNGVARFGNEFISANFSSKLNTLDRRYFPRRGTDMMIGYRFILDNRAVYHGSESGRELVSDAIEPVNKNFFELSAYYQKFFRVSRRWVISPRVQANFADMQLPLPGRVFVGGVPFQRRSNEVSFVGLSSREKYVQNFVMAQLNLRYRVTRSLNITGVANGLVSFLDEGPELPGYISSKDEEVVGMGLLVEYDSVIGPIQFGISNSNINKGLRWYFGLGYPF